ncbi:MAG: hypothetical protein ACRYFK_14660 [Janthinobacterium lividum]
MLLHALLLALSSGHAPAPARPAAPYPVRLTEADQELDYARFGGIHCISARVRGVRGLGGTVYWVSADGQRITAYRLGHRLWQTAVGPRFQRRLPHARVTKLILCSNTVFVDVGPRGYAELNRQTGGWQAFRTEP